MKAKNKFTTIPYIVIRILSLFNLIFRFPIYTVLAHGKNKLNPISKRITNAPEYVIINAWPNSCKVIDIITIKQYQQYYIQKYISNNNPDINLGQNLIFPPNQEIGINKK